MLFALPLWSFPFAIACSVLPGQEPAKPQGPAVKLRVLDRNGGPVQHATVTLLRVFDGNGAIRYGKVPEWSDRTLAPRDFEGDHARLDQLPLGKFALRVHAELHAHAFSEPFLVTAEDVPEVTVRVVRGGVLTGVVHDGKGKPVANAEVRTESPTGIASDNPFGALVAQFLPVLITETSVRSDAEGRFRLTTLAYGKYRLAVEHPEFVVGTSEVEVTDDQAKALPPIVLLPGTLVEGVATLDGKPSACIEVVIATPVSDTVAPGDLARLPSYHTVTDENGKYRFAQRIPVGTWRIHAKQIQAIPNGQQNPFDRLLQMQATQRSLEVIGELPRIEANFELQSKK